MLLAAQILIADIVVAIGPSSVVKLLALRDFSLTRRTGDSNSFGLKSQLVED